MRRRAFTLVEILIVLVIFWILAWIMLKTYTTITKVSFRIGQDKELAKESLILSQVLDNISQTATIDYEAYSNHHINLESSNGVVNTLYLTWDIWTWTSLYTTWDCQKTSILYDDNYVEQAGDFQSTCKLILEKDSEQIILLWDTEFWSWEYHVSEMKFRVVPYDTTKNIIFSNVSYSAGQPAFWIIWALYSKFYNPLKWSNSSIQPIQFFFGLKGETPSIYSSNDE